MTSDTLTMPAPAAGDGTQARGGLYLAFMLGEELFAIDILRIREIIEYSRPTPVPMMPRSVRGVINVRGAVVPVIDLSVRFDWKENAVGRRTCIVIVEIEHDGAKHVLGLVVDRVNAVTEIRAADVEPPPAFGARIDANFIAGMARIGARADGGAIGEARFAIMLDIERALTLEEIAAVRRVGDAAGGADEERAHAP